MTDDMQDIHDEIGNILRIIDSKEGWEFIFFFYMFLFLSIFFLSLIFIITPLAIPFFCLKDLIKKVRNID